MLSVSSSGGMHGFASFFSTNGRKIVPPTAIQPIWYKNKTNHDVITDVFFLSYHILSSQWFYKIINPFIPGC